MKKWLSLLFFLLLIQPVYGEVEAPLQFDEITKTIHLDESIAFNMATLKITAVKDETTQLLSLKQDSLELDFEEDGLYDVTIEIEDETGNLYKLDNLSVMVDTTPPLIDVMYSSASTILNEPLAIDVVSEEDAMMTITLFRQEEDEWQKEIITASTFTLDQEGCYYFEVVSKDAYENEATYTSEVITIDVTPPVITYEFDSTQALVIQSNEEVTFNIDGDWVEEKYIVHFEEGIVEIELMASDLAGNMTVIPINEVVDYSAPIFKEVELSKAVNEVGELHYYSSTFPLGIHLVYEDALTKVKKMYMDDGNELKIIEVEDMEYEFTVKDDFKGSITIWLEDEKGNLSETYTTPMIMIDSTVPKLSVASFKTTSNQPIIIEFEVEDDDFDPQLLHTLHDVTWQDHKGTITLENEGEEVVEIWYMDLSGNQSDIFKTNCSLDFTAPKVVQMEMNQAINNHFYNEPFKLHLEMEDAHQMHLNINVPFEWKEDKGKYICDIEISEDGEYEVLIEGEDSYGNVMTPIKLGSIVVDQTSPEYEINMDQEVYHDDVKIMGYIKDLHLEDYELYLTHYTLSKKEDMTSILNIQDEGSRIVFEGEMGQSEAMDGYYELDIVSKDQALNQSHFHQSFVVNRYGSIYVYDDAFLHLLGQRVQQVSQPLILTQYHPREMEESALHVSVTRDKQPLQVDYALEKSYQEGWWQYTYRLDPNNFKEDGYYKLTFFGTDKDGMTSQNHPQNSVDHYNRQVLDQVSFIVDHHAPQLIRMTGLEDTRIRAYEKTFTYMISDEDGLALVQLWNNDVLVNDIREFEDGHYYEGSYCLKASDHLQTLKLVAYDLCGNQMAIDLGSYQVGYEPVKIKEKEIEVLPKKEEAIINEKAPNHWPVIGVVMGLSSIGIFMYKKLKI